MAASDTSKGKTVPLDWTEVCDTNCPLVSAGNVDQELGWTNEEYKKIGVKYACFRSRAENDWYPHYIHNLDNLIRFGGLFPPIHAHADIRRTRLLGAPHVPWEGGCLMVRARDDIHGMGDLNGKRIGLTKSLSTNPKLAGVFMKGMIRVGRWANEHKHAAAAIPDRQTCYLDVEDTYQGIKAVDMAPNLSAQNLAAISIGKAFMLEHGYIDNDFDVHAWAAPLVLEQAVQELLEERWRKVTTDKLPGATSLRMG